MDDPKEVQAEVVSPETPSDKPPEGDKPPEPQPLTEEKVQQLIAEATEKAVEQGKESGRREMQGTKDREIAGLQGRIGALDQSFRFAQGQLQDNPEAQTALRMSQVEAENRGFRQREFDDSQRSQNQQTINYFETTLSEHATSLGIDLKDERLDWSRDIDPTQLSLRQGRFLASVGNITKESAKVADDKIQERIDAGIKDVEARLRKEQGLPDVVDTSLPAGSGLSDKETFINKMADPEYTPTAADWKRFNDEQ